MDVGSIKANAGPQHLIARGKGLANERCALSNGVLLDVIDRLP